MEQLQQKQKFEKILPTIEAMIQLFCNKIYSPVSWIDKDDIKQELIIHCWKKYDQYYDPKKGRSYISFLYNALRNITPSLINHLRVIKTSNVPFDETYHYRKDKEKENYSDEYDDFMGSVKLRLGKKIYDILDLYLLGYSGYEIADIKDVTPQYIYFQINKIKKFYHEEYKNV